MCGTGGKRLNVPKAPVLAPFWPVPWCDHARCQFLSQRSVPELSPLLFAPQGPWQGPPCGRDLPVPGRGHHPPHPPRHPGGGQPLAGLRHRNSRSVFSAVVLNKGEGFEGWQPPGFHRRTSALAQLPVTHTPPGMVLGLPPGRRQQWGTGGDTHTHPHVYLGQFA